MFRLQSVFFVVTLLNLYFLNIHGSVFIQSNTTTLSLIADYGYPAEQHKVKTDDDYIVTLYRIPFSPKNKTTQNNSKPVIFIMHGTGGSSSDFVISGSPMSLALLLSDKGYDIWLGNARGNRFSQEHSHLSVRDPRYWNFDWHEIGLYDIPANVDYILQNTSSSQLQYIGHSQGTTSFFVAASLLPDLKYKINSAFLMAPVAFVSHVKNPLLPLASSFGKPTPSIIGYFELLPNTVLNANVTNLICKDDSPIRKVCTVINNAIYNVSSIYTNRTALNNLIHITPAGLSIKQAIHYLQLYNSGAFRQFDYGIVENLLRYKQLEPLDYPVNEIEIPTHAYYAESDPVATPQDVEKLLNLLPSTTVKKAYKMPFKRWTHIDFVLANNVDKLFYSIILDDLEKARSSK